LNSKTQLIISIFYKKMKNFMKKVITTLALSLVLIGTVSACRCVMDDAKLFYYIDAKYVFKAEVETASDCGDNNKYEYKLEVDKVYKGELEDEITIYSDCITSCSFQLEAGKTYLFFTDLINGNLGFCEYRLSKSSPDYKAAIKYLGLIERTNLDFLKIKDAKDQPLGDIQVVNGQVDGLVKLYFPDGSLRLRGLYIKGVPNGNFEMTEKMLRSTEKWAGDYKNGQRSGRWIRIFKDNKTSLHEHIFYEDGEIVDRYVVNLEAQLDRFAPKKKQAVEKQNIKKQKEKEQ
jgi:hypothetical protein